MNNLVWNGNAAKAKIMAALQAGLAETAKAIEEQAKGSAPVQSGQLRDSIHAEVEGLQATISADAPYAAEIELGTEGAGSRPFLGTAPEKASLEIIQAFKGRI